MRLKHRWPPKRTASITVDMSLGIPGLRRTPNGRRPDLMATWLRIYRLCLSGGTPRRSLLAALIVGSILNLINQGDALFGDAKLNVLKALLTFVVPYCVSTYGAVSVQLRRDRGSDPAHAGRSGHASAPDAAGSTCNRIGGQP